MPAIPLLPLLGNKIFKSGAKIFEGSLPGSLVERLNVIITKLDTLLTRWNAGSLDKILIGTGPGYLYGGGGGAGFSCDGTNPPTLDAFRIQDQWDGAYVTTTYNSLGGAHSVANFIVV